MIEEKTRIPYSQSIVSSRVCILYQHFVDKIFAKYETPKKVSSHCKTTFVYLLRRRKLNGALHLCTYHNIFGNFLQIST